MPELDLSIYEPGPATVSVPDTLADGTLCAAASLCYTPAPESKLYLDPSYDEKDRGCAHGCPGEWFTPERSTSLG